MDNKGPACILPYCPQELHYKPVSLRKARFCADKGHFRAQVRTGISTLYMPQQRGKCKINIQKIGTKIVTAHNFT